MRTIIIDDDKASIETLSKKLQKYPQLELCGTANTCSTGIHLTAKVNPEVIFLDIELPDMSGLEFLTQLNRTVRGWCKVIIYTGHPGYMLHALRLSVFDYLMKPVDEHELKNVVRRLGESKEKDDAAHRRMTEGNTQTDKKLIYTNSSDFRLIKLQDVCAFQYNHDQRLWEVIIAGEVDPVKLKRSTNCSSILEMDPRFVQVSQKYIVNIDYLIEVSQNNCVFYPPFDRVTHIKVGRPYRKKLIERFNTL